MANRRIILPIIVLMAMACRESDKKKPVVASREPTGVSFYVGTYTDGTSKGIYKYYLAADGSLSGEGLMAESENPSFLAISADGLHLLAVNEVSDETQTGYLSSFKIGKDTLELIDQKPTGGAHPCHVVTNDQGYVVVANYSGGNMGLLKVGDDGMLSDLLHVQQHQGNGPHPRQEGPHAHSGWFASDGSVISVDLGTNQLWFSRIDPEGNTFIPAAPPTLSMAPGDGPRHLDFHPAEPWIYVLNELSSTVSLVKKDTETGAFAVAQTVTTLPLDFEGENTCADIHLSSDGKFLYASNRGHNSIAFYSVDLQSGSLKLLGHEAVRGATPRNFSLSPDGNFLLVANQTTDNIISFRRDPESGQLAFVDEIGAPTPVCILFTP